jgi:hypothetical protein
MRGAASRSCVAVVCVLALGIVCPVGGQSALSTWTNKGHDNDVHEDDELKPEDYLWQVSSRVSVSIILTRASMASVAAGETPTRV